MNDRQRRHESAQRHRFYRRWHRWIGTGAAIFLVFAAVTGFLVAFTEKFGEAERLRERNRSLTSPVTVQTLSNELSASVDRGVAAVRRSGGQAPVDKVVVEFKGEQPRISIFTGKVGGGEDRKYVVDYKTGRLIKSESYADKPFLYRLHSGEAIGDGGLILAMAWALALAVLGLTGLYISNTMRKRANPET